MKLEEALAKVVFDYITNKPADAAYGEADIAAALRPALTKHKVVMLPPGWRAVPPIPEDAQLQIAGPAFEGINHALEIAAKHGITIVAIGGKPPAWHAYVAMVAAAGPPPTEIVEGPNEPKPVHQKV